MGQLWGVARSLELAAMNPNVHVDLVRSREVREVAARFQQGLAAVWIERGHG